MIRVFFHKWRTWTQVTQGDPWCSSGGVRSDGTFISTGGFSTGGKSIRYMGPYCDGCEWREYDNVLATDRWYQPTLFIYITIFTKQKSFI